MDEEEKALQQEADFLAWWTAEEERVRLEAEIAAIAQNQSKPTKKGKKADQNQTGNQGVRTSRGRGDGGL